MRSVRFDLRAFDWLGSVSAKTYVGAIWHSVAADTIEKMKRAEVVLGSTGTSSLNYQVPILMNEVLGTRFKMITGYPGGGELNLAIERGEIQDRTNFYEGFTGAKQDWIRENKIKFFFVMGRDWPELASVPKLKPLMPGEEERQMLTLLEATLEVGQAFFLPPSVLSERIDALRLAFAQMLADTAFLAVAKQRDFLIDPRSPAQVEAVINSVYRTPPALAKKLATVIGIQAEGN